MVYPEKDTVHRVVELRDYILANRDHSASEKALMKSLGAYLGEHPLSHTMPPPSRANYREHTAAPGYYTWPDQSVPLPEGETAPTDSWVPHEARMPEAVMKLYPPAPPSCAPPAPEPPPDPPWKARPDQRMVISGQGGPPVPKDFPKVCTWIRGPDGKPVLKREPIRHGHGHPHRSRTKNPESGITAGTHAGGPPKGSGIKPDV